MSSSSGCPFCSSSSLLFFCSLLSFFFFFLSFLLSLSCFVFSFFSPVLSLSFFVFSFFSPVLSLCFLVFFSSIAGSATVSPPFATVLIFFLDGSSSPSSRSSRFRPLRIATIVAR